ncbi:NADH-quinone oxidoreductase subunit NuoK [Sulfurospirillum multivorans]|uniref:NADH-quinone oxidoreductase subunit K n=2 Tax=Sulfurospirillum multivorans TaxID=66821 RepID=A0AA86E1I6_SULMK|nr:NADH-quinone oxidoreductase subunit NuoK [Sulfurospirillum multivorans]AHJ11787.1 NADH-ubiquinone oxidoreductase chain K [Sulfurospirillum multivorans DSM 12446]QEH05293.1 NADH-ubiquinone oxidoreductase chain K [Sulfurospirillum multivorans]
MIANTLFGYIVVAMILFSIGLLGVISRKNIFVIYMSIELMLNAVNLMFVALSNYHHDMGGHVMAMLIIAIAAAEAGVFLSLIIVLYRRKKSLDSDLFRTLSQKEAV